MAFGPRLGVPGNHQGSSPWGRPPSYVPHGPFGGLHCRGSLLCWDARRAPEGGQEDQGIEFFQGTLGCGPGNPACRDRNYQEGITGT